MLFALYELISFGLFFGIAVKSQYDYQNVYDGCMALVNEKLYSIIFLNFFAALGFLIANLFARYYFGKFSSSEFNNVMTDFRNLLGRLLFQIVFIRTAGFGMQHFFYALLPAVLTYSSFYAKQRIASFSILATLPSIESHQRIAVGQFLLFFIYTYSILTYGQYFFKTKISMIIILLSMLFHGFITLCLDIVRHAIFIFDRPSFGTSQKSFRANLTAELIFNIIQLIIEVLLMIYYSLDSVFILMNLRMAYDAILNIYKKINTYLKYHELQKMIKDTLPDATAEDLQKEATCIICRNEMKIGQAKKLSCGHCFHIDCLERWSGQQNKCPTCQKDLTEITKQQDQQPQEGQLDETPAAPQNDGTENPPNVINHLNDIQRPNNTEVNENEYCYIEKRQIQKLVDHINHLQQELQDLKLSLNPLLDQ